MEERSTLQPIDVTIVIDFSKEPIGCQSDDLSQVCCYKILSEQIVQSIENKSFHLIESLAAHIFDIVAHQINGDDGVIEVTVIKPYPPVQHIQKGVAFTYCKQISQKYLSELVRT